MTPAAFRLCLFLSVFLFPVRALALEPSDLTRSWDAVLAQVVDERGRVDYQALADSPEALDAAYAQYEALSPDSDPDAFNDEAERFAYWLNAYNVAVVKGVVKHYPIKSVRDVKPFSAYSLFAGGGFFAAQKFKFGGKKMNLHRLEQKLIRKRFADPRLHFALNCASIGCPELPPEAFDATRLEEQLERETKEFIQSERNVRVDTEAKIVYLSTIFDWYASDFTDYLAEKGYDNPDLIDYALLYLEGEAADKLKMSKDDYEIEFLPYDWGLNDQAL